MNKWIDKLLDGMFVYLLIAFVLTAVAVVLGSAFWPYHPYELHKYTVEPKTACPGEIVEVFVSRTMQPGQYELIVDGEWNEVGTNQSLEVPIGGYNIHIPPGKELEQHVISPLYQEAPEKAGKWVFEADITVQGRVGVLPRKQYVYEEDGRALRVLSTEECAPYRGKE